MSRNIIRATIREAVNDGKIEYHVECKFSNGEKYAPIVVDEYDLDVAETITDLLNIRVEPCM